MHSQQRNIWIFSQFSETYILIITRSFYFKFFILSPNCAFSKSLAIFYMPNREIKYEK